MGGRDRNLQGEFEKGSAGNGSNDLQYQDQYVMLPYHKLSAGKTRSGQEAFGSESYPYLPARDCPKDLEAKEQLQECVLPYHKVKEKCRKFLTAVENPEETKEDKKQHLMI